MSSYERTLYNTKTSELPLYNRLVPYEHSMLVEIMRYMVVAVLIFFATTSFNLDMIGGQNHQLEVLSSSVHARPGVSPRVCQTSRFGLVTFVSPLDIHTREPLLYSRPLENMEAILISPCFRSPPIRKLNMQLPEPRRRSATKACSILLTLLYTSRKRHTKTALVVGEVNHRRSGGLGKGHRRCPRP